MPRHGENIWKRKDGRWEARYIKTRHSSGKAVYASVYAKTYKEVKKKRDAAVSLSPLYVCDRSELTLKEITEQFLQAKKTEVKQSTITRYTEIAEWYIYPKMGAADIASLEQGAVERFSSELLKTGKKDGTSLSAKTVRDVLELLKQIIKYAEKKLSIGHIELDLKPPKQSKTRVQILTKAEQNKLEAVVLDLEDPMKYGTFLCLYTGLRIGELCALRWRDLDLDSGILSVNNTVLRLRDYDAGVDRKTKLILEAPKTASSKRQIPLPNTIIQQLLHLKSVSPASRSAFFLTGSDRFVEPRNYYEKYKKYLILSDLSAHTFHALRHTFATRCIENSVDPKVLSEILGHASVQITLDRYVHPSIDTKRECLEKLLKI